MECRHIYKRIETIRRNVKSNKDDWHSRHDIWLLIDRFYCIKCLKIEEKEVRHQGNHRPDWW
jgi:hypothetical protein